MLRNKVHTEFTVNKALIDGTIVDNVGIEVRDGKIADIVFDVAQREQHYSGVLVPGFIDLQVNGGGGMLFNRTPTVTTLETIFNAHCQFGTTSMTPTLISDELSVMRQSADAVAEAIALGMTGIVGIHFEGPLLATAKKGVHPEAQIRSASDEELALYTRQDLGKVIITLAPENVPVDIIRDLTQQGVLVCLGHSNASYDQVLQAIEAGASGFTHLFNAMSSLQSREPGMVGAALTEQHTFSGLIVDHHHVHPANARFAIRSKGADKVFLVTDAMAHVGTQQEALPYFDTVITKQNNKLTTPDGTLAGSCLDMMQAVLKTHHDLKTPFIDAITMATSTPAHYLGMGSQVGTIVKGAQADFVMLDDALRIQSVFVAGEIHNAERSCQAGEK